MRLTSLLLLGMTVFWSNDAFAAFVPTIRPRGNQTPSSMTRFSPPSCPYHTRSLRMSETAQESISIDQVNLELKQQRIDFDTKIAAAGSAAEVETLRREYLGKKGPINQVMQYMRNLSNEDKPKLGAVVNEVKDYVEKTIAERMEELEIKAIDEKMRSEYIDVTKPGISRIADIGRRHPLSMTMEKAVEVFVKLGYDTVTSCNDSPEIESDYYCFEALNCPKDHPSRDMQDTFYLTEDREYLLRTHTSSVQIRQLEKRRPPLRIVAPGRVYRKDDIDATHSLMFHQVEILAIEERGELNLGHLKGTVEHFLKEMLGPEIKIRFRGSYFPFTEPSMEVDVYFRGKWMEVLGCGMVDPRVLEMAGIDAEKYTGFAAGFGVERFAMVIHEIKDLREFTKNDKRFLEQFPHFYDDGMTTFLSGRTTRETPTDPRGESFPVPPVNSLEELVDRHKVDSHAELKGGGVSESSGELLSENAESQEIDFSKLDVRVGVIKKAWEHEAADKLFCEEIDIGEGSPRQIASGLRDHYKLQDLEGQRVLVLANLKSRKLMGFLSHGMVLCASDSNGKVKFVEPPPGATIGERVFVDGFEGEPATENQIMKKKMLDVIFPDLKTNDDGLSVYRGSLLRTSTGPCLPTIPNASVA